MGTKMMTGLKGDEISAEDDTTKDEDIIIDDQTDINYKHVFFCNYLVMVIFLLIYLESTFYKLKKMSNTMCMHYAFMHRH